MPIRPRFIYPILIAAFFSGCTTPTQTVSDPYQHISDADVVALLKKSFATQGGLDNWMNKKELHYTKHTTLFLESGAIENDVIQQHDYYYQPSPKIHIRWNNKSGESEEIVKTDDSIKKLVSGKEDETAKAAALQTSVTTSLFVIGVPFKILDKGVQLSYAGTDQLEDNQEVAVIKAVYDPASHAHHTTQDIWWYYFDKSDHRLVGYMVKHADHYSYVKNTAYTRSGPFIFPVKRESYRVSPEREILYVRARYSYDNWKVEL